MDVVFNISFIKTGFLLLSLSRSVQSIFSVLFFPIFRAFVSYFMCFWSRYVF